MEFIDEDDLLFEEGPERVWSDFFRTGSSSGFSDHKALLNLILSSMSLCFLFSALSPSQVRASLHLASSIVGFLLFSFFDDLVSDN